MTGPTLQQQVRILSEQEVELCYHCHKCTAGCPVAVEMEFGPDRVLRMIQLGQGDRVLTGRAHRPSSRTGRAGRRRDDLRSRPGLLEPLDDPPLERDPLGDDPARLVRGLRLEATPRSREEPRPPRYDPDAREGARRQDFRRRLRGGCHDGCGSHGRGAGCRGVGRGHCVIRGGGGP